MCGIARHRRIVVVANESNAMGSINHLRTRWCGRLNDSKGVALGIDDIVIPIATTLSLGVCFVAEKRLARSLYGLAVSRRRYNLFDVRRKP